MPPSKTVMVRLLVDVETVISDEAIVQTLRVSSSAFANRMWIAVDHPRPQDAEKLWSCIASGRDPHGAGSARKGRG